MARVASIGSYSKNKDLVLEQQLQSLFQRKILNSEERDTVDVTLHDGKLQSSLTFKIELILLHNKTNQI